VAARTGRFGDRPRARRNSPHFPRARHERNDRTVRAAPARGQTRHERFGPMSNQESDQDSVQSTARNHPQERAATRAPAMRALSVSAPRKMELREIAAPEVGPAEALIKSGAVGLCGTDFHIYEGHANYNYDAAGRTIPFEERPQILGHEFCGVVAEVGAG